ncbi:hypothetical protein CK203_050379 [Vitis vinifera]|uniref:Uncharacterized protein n=1 Tax=Vitis vinifera TaxID=29760 RepID=A0A438GM54_VITVI|nr:hypothetical protein CK203_050379 [Vitis vinifera]
MSSSLLLMEPMGGSFGRFLPAGRSARCEVKRSASLGVTMGVTMPEACRGSWGLALYAPGTAPVDPGYIDSGSGLEFATWPLER